MSVFIRREARPGQWGYRCLVTDGDTSPSTVPSERVLTMTQSDVTGATGLWDSTYSQVFTVGHASRRKMASKLSQPRPVVLTLTSGDASGLEARTLKRFFTFDGPIEYYDTTRNVPPTNLYVTSIAVSAYDGSVTVEVSAHAVFSDEMVEDKIVLQAAEDLGASSPTTLSLTMENKLHSEATLRVTLKVKDSKSPVDFTGAKIVVKSTSDATPQAAGSITFEPATQGDATLGFTGYEWTVDSLDETIAGSGVVQPDPSTRFFSYPAGSKATIVVTITPPASKSPLTVEVDAVGTFARGTWAQVSKEDSKA